MKLFKQTTVLAIVIVMLMSILVVPAFAAGIVWQNAFATFPELYQGHTANGHIKFLQRFLYCYSNDTKNILIENGHGIDGGYGPQTEEAVKHFQDDFKDTSEPLVVDGRAGENTWRRIAKLMVYGDESHFLVAKVDNGDYYEILHHVLVGSSSKLYTYDANHIQYSTPFDVVNLTQFR